MYQKITYYSRMSQTLHVPVPAIVSGWTPASLTNLFAWYKADTGVYSDAGITPAVNGSIVKQWNDQSGNNIHLTQAVGGNEPKYVTSALNGLPVVDNNNIVNGQLGICTAASAVSGLNTTVFSVFCVVKFTNADGSGRMFSVSADTNGGVDTGGDGLIIYEPTSLTTVTAYQNGDKSTGVITASSWNELGTICDGVNNTLYINNIAQAPVADAPTIVPTTGAFGILCRGGDNINPLTGQMAEVVVTKSAIDSTDRGKLNTYFLGRWGV